jgi:3-dehydroquinate dehydratase I
MICIPLKYKSPSSLLENFKKAQKEGDLTEIWFDELQNISPSFLAKLKKLKKKPIIYKSYGEEKNIKKVLNLIDYIDLDLESSLENIPKKVKIIISYHDFKKTPSVSDLKKIIKKMKAKGADIYKIATFAKDINDSFTMLNFLSEIPASQKTICLCMGEHGKITRLSGHLFGNFLTYAALSSKTKTAPGQLTIKELWL